MWQTWMGLPFPNVFYELFFSQIDIWRKSSGFGMTWQYIEKNVCLFFLFFFQWEMAGWAILRKHRTMQSMLAQQHPLSPKLWATLVTNSIWLVSYATKTFWKNNVYTHRYWNVTRGNVLSFPAFGPVEARRPADFACRPGGGEPDATAVWQNGRWQHQNEALDGGDLCAFNRQREAVVKVEVTSFFPFSPLSPSHSGKGEMVWPGAGNGSQEAAFLLLVDIFCFFHTTPKSCTFPSSFLKQCRF